MTIVEGQIETLKRIKNILSENGITRFSSIGDINEFLKNFNSEVRLIYSNEEHELDQEIRRIQVDLDAANQNYHDIQQSELQKYENKITSQKSKINSIESNPSNNIFFKLYRSITTNFSKKQLAKLENQKDKVINQKTNKNKIKIEKISNTYKTLTENRKDILSQRAAPKLHKLNNIKNVVRDLGPLIAGAIGEDLVVKEIKKLSDDFVLFNDFSAEFNPPIYNKKENDRIHSIQIDHLLVTDAGIFILETKNWSKNSIENLDLRSPVNQIMRTSYALFVTLNSDLNKKASFLNRHHWGDKQVPIRNVVVMIKNKPNEAFQYVKVKTLEELNGYITFFEAIFDKEEVMRISDKLRSIQNH